MASFVEALSRQEAYPHATGTIEVVETHISWIFLAGSYAYKVKKPLDLGFLDFSTLEKRRHFCNEELRLNRRLCPEIYLSVVPVVRSPETFLVDAEGEVVDYAVKMVRFDRAMELDRMLGQKLLKSDHVTLLAGMVAQFHMSLSAAPAESEFGHPDHLIKPVLANFTHTEPVVQTPDEAARLETLKAWTAKEHQSLFALFLRRKKEGFIRQCHGDMHTGNMVLWKNRIFIFDCIEFNENLSIIDVISDLAFLFMDLIHGGERGLAWRLLNSYLSETGDYAALPLLRFYTVYRAMVRAKVTAIRYAQSCSNGSASTILEEHRSYISLARECTLKKKPLLILTFGLSGSGKTKVSGDLAPEIQALHIRSDIERKRLAGLKPLERSREKTTISLYTEEISRQTYQRLLDLAGLCIREGVAVIVDATFLKACDRKLFMDLAEFLNCPCRILSFHAPEKVLLERVQSRYLRGNDASEADPAVLASQFEKQEKLTAAEKAVSMEINTDGAVDIQVIAARLQSCLT